MNVGECEIKKKKNRINYNSMQYKQKISSCARELACWLYLFCRSFFLSLSFVSFLSCRINNLFKLVASNESTTHTATNVYRTFVYSSFFSLLKLIIVMFALKSTCLSNIYINKSWTAVFSIWCRDKKFFWIFLRLVLSQYFISIFVQYSNWTSKYQNETTTNMNMMEFIEYERLKLIWFLGSDESIFTYIYCSFYECDETLV